MLEIQKFTICSNVIIAEPGTLSIERERERDRDCGGLNENDPCRLIWEYLVISEWNCLGRTRRIGGVVSLE